MRIGYEKAEIPAYIKKNWRENVLDLKIDFNLDLTITIIYPEILKFLELGWGFSTAYQSIYQWRTQWLIWSDSHCTNYGNETMAGVFLTWLFELSSSLSKLFFIQLLII